MRLHTTVSMNVRPSFLVTSFWALQKEVTRLPGRIPGAVHRTITGPNSGAVPTAFTWDSQAVTSNPASSCKVPNFPA